jgi:HAD superfamily hydrolase (TIGR01450 family)
MSCTRKEPVTWVLDLDGVVWRGSEPILGSVDAIRDLKNAGVRVAYVTNNSLLGATDQVAKLASMGIDATPDDVVSAHDMLLARVGSDKTVMCAASPEMAAALRRNGNSVLLPDDFIAEAGAPASLVSPPAVDCVVVGLRFDMNLLHLSVAVLAALQCGTVFSTNRDPLYPFSTGMLMGTGSVVAAVEHATGLPVETMGKPAKAMVDEMLRRFPDAALVVGDQRATDGELARRAGVPFALVRSGVDAERRSETSETPAAHEALDLATLVETLL